MPLEFIEPQLAASVDHPPPRAGWIHEVKHDGYRTLLIVEPRKARAYTRNGFDWTDRYPAIKKASAKLDCPSAVIDGEIIIQNERGVSDFDALKSAIRWHPQRLILCAFDLLHLNGKDRWKQSESDSRGPLGSRHRATMDLPRCDNCVEQRQHRGMASHVIDMDESGTAVKWPYGFDRKVVSTTVFIGQLD